MVLACRNATTALPALSLSESTALSTGFWGKAPSHRLCVMDVTFDFNVLLISQFMISGLVSICSYRSPEKLATELLQGSWSSDPAFSLANGCYPLLEDAHQTPGH